MPTQQHTIPANLVKYYVLLLANALLALLVSRCKYSFFRYRMAMSSDPLIKRYMCNLRDNVWKEPTAEPYFE